MDISKSITDAVNGLTDAAFLVDDSGVIVAANRVATAMFGYTRGQLVGSQVDDLMPMDAREYHKNARAGAVADRQPRSFTSGVTFECERRGGERFQADINLSPTEVDGVPMTWAIVRDLDGPTELNEGRRQAMAALDAIGKVATSTFDLDQDFSSVAEGLAKVVPHSRIAVLIRSQSEPSQVEVVYRAGEFSKKFKKGETVPYATSATRAVVDAGTQLYYSSKNFESAPASVQAGLGQGMTGTCVSPILDSETVIGSLIVATKHPSGFTEFQRGLIDRLASHVSVAIVNGRMREMVEKQADEIQLVNEIGQLVSSSADLERAFTSAEELIRRFIHFDRLSIFTIDPDERILRRCFVIGDQLGATGREDFQISQEQLVEITVGITDQRPSQMNSEELATAAESSTSFTPLVEGGYQRALFVPMIVTQLPMGFLVFSTRSDAEYTEQETTTATLISEQVAGPILNSFLLEKANEEARVERLIAEVGSVVGSTLDLQSTEPVLGPLLRELIDCASIMISSVNEGRTHLRLMYMDYDGIEPEPGLIPTADNQALYPIKGTTSEIVLDSKESVVLNAASGEAFKAKYPGAGAAHKDAGLKNVINVPLIANDEVFGFLTFRSAGPEDYRDSDRELAETIAKHLASSVAFIELRRRDANLAEERSALISAGNIMNSALDLTTVWDEFAAVVSELVPTDHIALTGVDRDSGMVHILHDSLAKEMQRYGRQSGDSFPIVGTVTEALIETGESLIHSTIDRAIWTKLYPNSHPSTTKNPIRSMIGVPLIWGGDVVAGLFVHSVDAGAYDRSDLEIIERFAAQIAGPVAGSILRNRESDIADKRDVLVKIGSLVGSATDLDSVWDEFGELLADVIEFDRCVIVAIDHELGEAHVLQDNVKSNPALVNERFRTTGQAYSLAGTAAEHLAKTGRSLILNQDEPNQLLNQFRGADSQGFSLPFLSNLGIPLSWGGEVVGCIFFGSEAKQAYGDADIEIGERVAAQISGPIAGALLRQREIELEAERQRRVIAETEASALAELSETKSNFVGAMSHELKTPLTSIVAFADILSRDSDQGLEGRPLQQVKVIQRNARHLEGMINELLDLSRMESGRFEITKSPFDFAALVDESLESSQPQFEATEQIVDFKISSDVLLVNGDRDRLIQVVNNLLNNASKYSPKGSDVEIDVGEIDRWLVVEVRDRGPGVPEDNPEGLFEMFHRADNELTRRVPGTGIGLHVSKRIIDEHGGEITLNPREGGGAVAMFRIPIGVNALN